MANIILGKVAITWKGEWSASNSYSEQDVVRDGADTYICIEEEKSMGTAGANCWRMGIIRTRTQIFQLQRQLIVHNGADCKTNRK